MKAIMISDKPKWCALMMNGIKTKEVRTSKALATAIQKLIDKYGYADIYVCCTKGKPNLWLPYEYDCFESDEASQPYLSDKSIVDIDTKMNGKVVFKFRCYKVEHFEREYLNRYVDDYYYDNGEPLNKKFYKETCLTEKELFDYIGSGSGYAIKISDLEIFDKPKELSEFYNLVEETIRPDCPLKCKWWCITNYDCKYYVEDDCYGGQLACACPTKKVITKKPLTKAPQNFCYIESEE